VAEPRAGHAEHDPFAIAALLDPDLAPTDRMVGEALVASCPECASLRDDLVALSSATTNMASDGPAPARPRDFRLTAEDAARLAATSAAEPVATTARLAGVMTERPIPASHAGHDTLLVASLVDHSLGSAERASAEALVDECNACADIHADLMALRDATRAMPTPDRPRDYALTQHDAARLRRGGLWRLVAAIGSPRDGFSRPLAVGLTTLGLAGLLLVSVPSMLQFGGASPVILSAVGAAVGDVPQPEVGTDSNGVPVAAPAASAAPAPAAGKSAGPVTVESAPPRVPAQATSVPMPAAMPPGQDAFGGPGQGADGVAARPSAGDFGIKGGAQPPARQTDIDGGAAASSPSGFPLLPVVSGLFLLLGLGLFAIRWSARRLGDG
jgi:hypothetical protein